jgi:hypothetical protein
MKLEHPRCSKVVGWIGCGWAVVGAFISGFAKVHDDGNWGRKAVSYFTLYITGHSLYWAMEYTISQTGKDGAGTALVIAAVMAPIAVLQAAIAKFYFEANTRTEQIAAGQPPLPSGSLSVTAKAVT